MKAKKTFASLIVLLLIAPSVSASTFVAGFLVDYQSSKTPDVSGYPINVVEITAGEVNVKHCESVCEWNH